MLTNVFWQTYMGEQTHDVTEPVNNQLEVIGACLDMLQVIFADEKTQAMVISHSTEVTAGIYEA